MAQVQKIDSVLSARADWGDALPGITLWKALLGLYLMWILLNAIGFVILDQFSSPSYLVSLLYVVPAILLLWGFHEQKKWAWYFSAFAFTIYTLVALNSSAFLHLVILVPILVLLFMHQDELKK